MSDERVARAALAQALGVEDAERIVIERGGATLSLSVLRTATRRGGGASKVDVRVAVAIGEHAGERIDERPALRVGARAPESWGVRLGLHREVQTGDARFDARAQIESHAREAVLRATFGEAARRHVLTLLELQCIEVGLFVHGGSEADTEPLTADVWVRPRDEGDVARLEQIARVLVELARSLPAFSGPRTGLRSRWRDVALAPFVTSPLAGILLTGAVFDTYRLVDVLPHVVAGLAGVGLLPLVLPLAFVALRGRPGAARDFALVALSSAVGLPALALGGALLINGALDTRPPEEHRVRVVDLRTRGTHVHLELTDWREPGGTIVARVEDELGRRVAVGDEVLLRVGPGRLGWPWVASVVTASRP